MSGRPGLIRFFQVVLVAIIAALVTAEALSYVPPLQARIVSTLHIEAGSAAGVNVSYSVTSTFPANLNLSTTVANGYRSPTSLYFYYDASYPSSWSSPVWSYGISQHISAVLDARGLHPDIALLDAAQLLGFVTDRSTTHSVLVMPTGVIPDTVFNTTVNYLAPWIRSGGTLLWFGDTIGYYAGQANTPLQYPSPSNPGDRGVSQFVNLSVFGPATTLYQNQSAASRAYEFTYQFGVPSHGLVMSVIQSLGGEPLGEISGNCTNAARLPLGNGTIDYFDIALTHDVTSLSESLVNMLQAGALTGPFDPVSLTSITVKPGVSSDGVVTVTLPYIPWLNATSSLCAVLYQTDILGFYGNSVCTVVDS